MRSRGNANYWHKITQGFPPECLNCPTPSHCRSEPEGTAGYCRTAVEGPLASFCRETHAFEAMGVNYPIKPGQIDGRCRHSLCHLGAIFVAKAAGSLGMRVWSRRSKAECVPPREED